MQKKKLVDESCMLNDIFQGYIKTQNQISDNFGFFKKELPFLCKETLCCFYECKRLINMSEL